MSTARNPRETPHGEANVKLPLLTAAAIIALASTSVLAQPQRFTLVCRYGNEAVAPHDVNVEVDLQRSTVNGYPARIDDGLIQWIAEDNFSGRRPRSTGTPATSTP